MTTETDNEQNKFPDYEFHPLAEIFPLMGDDELWQLTKDISKNGLLEPIVLFEGKILDGRNRYTACRRINEIPIFEEFDESLDPIDYVISLNLHRRHLNSAQRANIGLVILEKEREKGKEKQTRKPTSVSCSEQETKEPHDSLKKAAEQVGVSDKTLWQWEKISDVAREDGDIEIARVKALQGQRSIVSVVNEITQKEREQELQEKAKKPRAILGKIIHGDFFDKIKKIKDDSIDLLFVDPPYNILPEDWDTFESKKAFRAFCESWLNLVIPKVKDTGRIYICSSQEHKYLFYSFMQSNPTLFLKFHFGQEIIWHYKNNNKPSNRKLYRYAYEPIFYLYGKKAEELNFPPESYGETQNNVWTINIPQNNHSEGKFHKAQKPLELLRRIVLTGSREEDLILDPFAGSGTTGVACEELGRKYILIEKEKEHVEIIKGRLYGLER
ncbi:MAG: hypothetical protein GPJ52_01905 [Candidatus Heimdallarchaeota archaeon]|nr:hypothetical protein [Candidatus Heimdallarchaeota archaeon]